MSEHYSNKAVQEEKNIPYSPQAYQQSKLDMYEWFLAHAQKSIRLLLSLCILQPFTHTLCCKCINIYINPSPRELLFEEKNGLILKKIIFIIS